MTYYVDIVASQRNGTLYIGQTNDLARRVWEHSDGGTPSFTARYGVSILVWYQEFATRDEAFHCERRMKKWNRAWKIELIERFNPGWRDLLVDMV